MAYGVTPTGFVKKTLDVIKTQILSFWQTNISAEIDTSEDGLEAQLAGAFAEQLAEAWDAQEAEYAARDPAQAEGQALDDLLHIRGVYRKPATQSLVTGTVNLDAGTYTAGTLVATVAGDPTARFANDLTIVSVGGSQDILFRAEATGPTVANAGTLTVISNPVTGWNSVTNAADALLGKNIESDADYYQRSEEELGSNGSTTADAVRAALLALTGVRFARVYPNDDDATNGLGIPGHSIECLVLGGDAQTIRNTILTSKAAGIKAYGSTTGTASDSQGNIYNIYFSIPSAIDLDVGMAVTVTAGVYPGDEVLKQSIADWVQANQGVGKDVILGQLYRLLMECPGVVDSYVDIGLHGGSRFQANYAITERQYATLSTNHIFLTSTVGGAP